MKALTLQEIRILKLIGNGLSSAQIGDTLGISSHTVDAHRKNLLLKFEAKNAAELVLKAVQRKILNVTAEENG